MTSEGCQRGVLQLWKALSRSHLTWDRRPVSCCCCCWWSGLWLRMSFTHVSSSPFSLLLLIWPPINKSMQDPHTFPHLLSLCLSYMHACTHTFPQVIWEVTLEVVGFDRKSIELTDERSFVWLGGDRTGEDEEWTEVGRKMRREKNRGACMFVIWTGRTKANGDGMKPCREIITLIRVLCPLSKLKTMITRNHGSSWTVLLTFWTQKYRYRPHIYCVQSST